MKDFRFYELVNAKMRGTIDLRVGRHSINKSFAIACPEAVDVMVFRTFYCFRAPVSSVEESVKCARRLGRVLARETREFTQKAMLSYDSEKHPRSNQLFKAVKGKKRLEYCLRLLEEALVES